MSERSEELHQPTEGGSAALPTEDRGATAIAAQEEPFERVDSSVLNPSPITHPFVYALGRMEPRFPTLGVEKEFAQVAGRNDTAGLTDREALQSLLSERDNRYLARQLCWVFTIEGIDTYILQPRDPANVDLLVEALRPNPRPTDIDVVIGVLGPIAPPDVCNALMVPLVFFDQLYSFDVDALLGSIPSPKGMKAEQFASAAEELFFRIAQMNDNAGATDADRALNYLSVRYPAIYHLAAERLAADVTLTSVDVRLSRLSGVRKIVDVIFAYTDRKSDVTGSTPPSVGAALAALRSGESARRSLHLQGLLLARRSL